MKKRIITGAFAALLVAGCVGDSVHNYADYTEYFSSISSSFRGIDGVMPTIGKIYIDSVEIDTANDGDLTNMRKAALKYVLSADLIVDNYTTITGDKAKCVWQTTALGTSFLNENGAEISDNGKKATTSLYHDDITDSYACTPIHVYFTKEGTETNFDPDSIITLSYTNSDGEPIKRVGYDATYTTSIVLNTADRHNILTVATSPTTVLYYRADGLFQAGFTAFRGLKGIDKYIGSATYEARVKSPGGTDNVSKTIDTSYYTNSVKDDIARMKLWESNSSVNEAKGIYSESAFVSSYGPPIALPPFREGLTEKDYRKLRLTLMRHNNFPIVISNDKKLYTMGRVSNFTREELTFEYRFFIRSNDNWFQYSGVDINENDDSNKLHVGEIRIADGTPAKFVSTLSVTSDLGTIISLNEYDKEYYIAGNPFYNEGFCNEQATFNYETYSFNFDTNCTYNPSKKVGAVKIPGLQKLIGDGEGVLATDTHIYYSGNDGKMYQIDILPTGENYLRIKNGLPVVPRVMGIDSEPNIQVDSPIKDRNERDKLYAIDIGLPNMNPVVAPTLLLNDGSIVFTIRKSDNDGKITYIRKHFYVNTQDPSGLNKPGDLYNVPITNILGPTVGYGADGKLYYFTDVHALGVSYAPTTNETDKDFLAFIYGDPVQQLGNVDDKTSFFAFNFGELNIHDALKNVGEEGEIVGNDFVLMPYNPYTDAVEDISYVDTDGNIVFAAEKFRPFRTNTHLFVNLKEGAKYNYIVVPHYAYAFDNTNNVERSSWIAKKNGLMASEVRHNSISKVFGAFKNPKVPFKYTPYGRNTAFFANKKGVFAFADYDVRKTKNLCQGTTSTTDTNGNSCLSDVKTLANENVPDYFYRANSNTYREEANGKNNYISTAFVSESRMSNFPNNEKYVENGFTPQLLSSYIRYEAIEYPDTSARIESSIPSIPGYIPQFFFETIKNHKGITFDESTDITKWLGNMYQLGYGAGMYHYYDTKAYPSWRARKLGTEVLQYQARYGTLIPMTHGATADYLFSNLVNYFDEGKIVDSSSEGGDYVLPRMYIHAHYTFYDRDQLRLNGPIDNVTFGGMDIEQKSISKYFSELNDNGTYSNYKSVPVGAGVGYIMDRGNYMWRQGSPAAIAEKMPVSPTKPMNDGSYFKNFVIIHR